MNINIKYLVIDVDGTMTDSGIYYDCNGNEMKKFCTRDAAGFFAAIKMGISIIVLTGRECDATIKRMKELQVTYLFQNVKDKYSFLKTFIDEKHIKREEIGYIGDDLNDLEAMQLVGFIACPADSCKEIIKAADYVSGKLGGKGVIRDIIENCVLSSAEWDKAVNEVYYVGR